MKQPTDKQKIFFNMLTERSSELELGMIELTYNDKDVFCIAFRNEGKIIPLSIVLDDDIFSNLKTKETHDLLMYNKDDRNDNNMYPDGKSLKNTLFGSWYENNQD